MANLSRDTVKDLILRTQRCFDVIDHENWDAEKASYRRTTTEMWAMAAKEAVPPEWREIVRVLAQGETYYGGKY